MFAENFSQLNFKYENDINYVVLSDVKRPNIPPLLWKLYKRNPLIINSHQILKNLLDKIYP